MSQIFNAMNKIQYARIYNYDRTGQLRKNGTAAIYIRAYLNGRNKYFPTKVYVAPKQWDKKNRCIINHPNQVRYNQAIRALETKLENFELTVTQNEGSITLARLADYNQEHIDISFTDFYMQELRKAILSNDTYSDQNQTLDKLKAYRKTVYFSELNYRFINGFDSYLY